MIKHVKNKKIFYATLLMIFIFLVSIIYKGTYSDINLDDVIIFDNSLEVDYTNNYIKYIDNNTKVFDIINKIKVKDGYSFNVLITNLSGVEKNQTDSVATGDFIVINISDKTIKYTIAVRGDANGDGKVTLTDLVQVRKHIVGWKNPTTNNIEKKTGINLSAIDMNADGNITLIDLVRIRKILVGIEEQIFLIKTDVNSINLNIGDSKEIKYYVYPSNVPNKSITWTSSNPNVATVNDGVIKAVGIGEAQITITANNSSINKQINVNVQDNTIMLEDFDNINEKDINEILSSNNIQYVVYPEIHIVNKEVESNNGVYFDFRESQNNGWAQIYNINANGLVANAFSQISDNYYLRFWISNNDVDDLYITLLINDNNSNYNYLKGSKLIKYNKNEESVELSNIGGYGENSSIKIPKGFSGWVNFSLGNRNGGNNVIKLNDVKYITFDIRPNNPTANTYYVIDNLCLSTKTSGDSYNIENEIKYKADLIGIFYTVWFDYWEGSNNSFANYSRSDGYVTGNVYNITNNSYGSLNSFHYWAQPYLGYYQSSNETVIRQHMEWLSDANVDFIFVDFTNLLDRNIFVEQNYKLNSSQSREQYIDWYETKIWDYQVKYPFDALLNEMKKMQDEGKDVPKIVPWLGTWQVFGDLTSGASTYVVERFYDEYFACNECEKYNDLWLYYDNNPLVMTTVDLTNSGIIIYDKIPNFTYRNVWALFNERNETIKINEWTWREKNNTLYGKNSLGELEEMSVNTAISTQHMSVPETVTSRRGGKTFYEQWNNVFDVHPKVTLIGTWNEWGAQRLQQSGYSCGEYCFTDQYNQEYSNDIEPMLKGHSDKYYRMLFKYIDDYKKYRSINEYSESNIDNYMDSVLINR